MQRLQAITALDKTGRVSELAHLFYFSAKKVFIRCRFARNLLLTTIGIGILLSGNSIANDQTPPNEKPKTWLPLTFDQSYQEALMEIVTHASTRRGCDQVLEAKFSDGSEPTNPKFIVTCADKGNNTLNLVYWQSDVDSDFSDVTYPEKKEGDALPAEEQASLRMLKIRNENLSLISECKNALESKLNEQQLYYSDDDVYVTQRGTQNAVVHIDYGISLSEYSPVYTATCRRDISNSTRLSIFPRPQP